MIRGRKDYLYSNFRIVELTSGQIHLDSINYNKLSSKEMDQFRGKYWYDFPESIFCSKFKYIR